MQNLTRISTIIKIIAVSYIILLFIAALTIIPYVDSYYYWFWSQHLQMAYVDGPPLIGYVIYLSTLIFGNSTLAINIVGTIVAIISFLIITDITRTILEPKDNNSNKIALIVGVLWLTNYHIVAHRIATFITYDGLVNLFELGAILAILKYITYKKNRYIYITGICAGLALFTKFSAIISLAIILAYFLFNPKLRQIFKSYHIYLTILIALVIFSPVLIWNYEHNWSSFIFQLHRHTHVQLAGQSHFYSIIWFIRTSLLDPILPFLIVLLISKYLASKKPKQNLSFTTSPNIKLLTLLQIGMVGFWGIMAFKSDVPDRWLLLFESLFTISVGLVLLKNNNVKLLFLIIAFNLIRSVGLLVQDSYTTPNLVCHNIYTQEKGIKFTSPFATYIKPAKNASDFCYLELTKCVGKDCWTP
ncbi:MAG: glycosyltransferase family 39 protein [Burkholderiales bacterium]|nr:glycosyltransferase family 39 protein [Burkholderiales bacterium]